MYDIIIIGYGPGSQQLIVSMLDIFKDYSEKLNYKIIESSNLPGNNFTKYPIHGRLLSNNKLYTGADPKSKYSERFDWNSIITNNKNILARNYSKDFYPHRKVISDMMKDIHSEYNLNVSFNETCLLIEKDEKTGIFYVKTEKNIYNSKIVVIATGYEPKILSDKDINGITLCTKYHEMKEKEYYRDKSVMIIGKGNSAFECANEILNEANMIMLASPSSVKLSYQTHYVGNVRMVNAVPIENYQLKSLSAILDCYIKKIQKLDHKYEVEVEYIHANEESEKILVDEVISAIGFKASLPNIIPNITIMNNGYPLIDGEFQSQDISNLFFAGALTHGLDYKKYSSSGFIHGFRYNSICLSRLLAKKILKKPIENIEEEINKLEEIIFDILNTDPGIYLQPGFLGVLITVENSKVLINGYCTKRKFDTMTSRSSVNSTNILLTLEYGEISKVTDVLNIDRKPGNPDESLHIHPVIRLSGNINDIIKLDENLFNKFDKSVLNKKIVKNLLESLKKV